MENSISELAVRMLSIFGLFRLYMGSSLRIPSSAGVDWCKMAFSQPVMVVVAGLADIMVCPGVGGVTLRSRVILMGYTRSTKH